MAFKSFYNFYCIINMFVCVLMSKGPFEIQPYWCNGLPLVK